MPAGLRWLILALKRRAKVALAAGIIVFGLGASLLFILPKQYHTTFAIEVLQPEPAANEVERLKSMLGSSKGGEVEEFSALARSHAVVDSALEMSGVVGKDTSPSLRDYATYKLREDITVVRESSSNVLTIYVPASTAALSHSLARNLLQSMEIHERESRIHRLRESRENLERLLRSVENRLRDTQVIRDSFAKVSDLERRITELQTKIKVARQDIERDVTLFRRQRMTLLQEYTEDWQEIREIDEKLAFLASFDDPNAKLPLSSPAVAGLRERRDSYLAMRTEESDLLGEFDGVLLASWKKHPGFDTLAAVDDEVKRLSENAESIRRDITRYSTAIESSPSRHRVIKQPVRPEYPSKPETRKVLLFAFLAAVVAAVAVAYAGEAFDTSLRTPEAIQYFAHVESLTQIPHMNGTIQKRADHPIAFGPAGELSPYAEPFRHLKTSILFSIPEVVGPVILVASTDREEGKSTIVSNLAMAFAEDRKVLLIGADLRRPKVHKILDVPDDTGLVHVLEDQATWHQAVRQTRYPNLSVITHGRVVSNSSVLLSRPAFGRMLKEAREKFDVVLIDSPPTLLVIDAAIIAPKADATVLVYSLGETQKDALLRALAVLKRVKANLVGIASNTKHEDMMERKRYYYYQQEEKK